LHRDVEKKYIKDSTPVPGRLSELRDINMVLAFCCP